MEVWGKEGSSHISTNIFRQFPKKFNFGPFQERRKPAFLRVLKFAANHGFVEYYYQNEVPGAEASINWSSLLCFFSRQLLRRFSEDGLANSAANTAVAAGSMGVDPTLGKTTRMFPNAQVTQNKMVQTKRKISSDHTF